MPRVCCSSENVADVKSGWTRGLRVHEDEKGVQKGDGGTETTSWRGWMARVTLKNAVHGERRDLAYWSNNFPANLVKFSFAKCRCQIPGSPSDF